MEVCVNVRVTFSDVVFNVLTDWSLIKVDASLLAYMCAISEVVECLSPLPPLPSPPHVFICFMCVSCPSSSIQTPVYHDNDCLQRPSPMYSLDHRWLIHCCNPPRIIKSLAGPARPPCKQSTSWLLCLPGILPGEGGRMVELLGLCTWFCQGWKRRALVLCT